MYMKNLALDILICFIWLTSCTTDFNCIHPETDSEKQMPTTLVKRISPKVAYNVIGSLGVYEKMLDTTMNTIAIHEINYGNQQAQTFRAVSFHNANMRDSKDFIEHLRINGINPFSEDGNKTDFMGKKLRFSSRKPGLISTLSSGIDYESTSSIHITAPDATQAVLNTPLCDASNFVVCWNSDSTNTNGVAIGIRWTGLMIFGDDYPNTEVINIETFPDTGSATLSSQMFVNIPDTAYCELIVLRGNEETISLDNNLVRVISESNDMLKIVIAKNLMYQVDDEEILCE